MSLKLTLEEQCKLKFTELMETKLCLAKHNFPIGSKIVGCYTNRYLGKVIGYEQINPNNTVVSLICKDGNQINKGLTINVRIIW